MTWSRKKATEYSRSWRERRCKLRLCIRCGKSNKDATQQCGACKEIGRRSQSDRRLKRIVSGTCSQCERKPRRGMLTCIVCSRGSILKQRTLYKKRGHQTSIVYFIQGSLSKRIKIGCTHLSISIRLKRLQTGSGEILSLLGCVPGGILVERKIHKRFSVHRLHGEWFLPARRILRFIRENCL